MLTIELELRSGEVETYAGPVGRIASVITNLPNTVPHKDQRFPADIGYYTFEGNNLTVRLEVAKGGTEVFYRLGLLHL